MKCTDLRCFAYSVFLSNVFEQIYNFMGKIIRKNDYYDRYPSSSYSFFLLFLQCMCEESHRRYLNFGHFELLWITLRHCPDGYCCISVNLVLLFSNAHLNVS